MMQSESRANLELETLLSLVVDTFAEAFPMTAARDRTAATPRLGEIAGRTMTGYATSVISCDAEAGIERELGGTETPTAVPA